MNDFFEGWIRNESADQDVVKVKCVYIDICGGNLTDGVLFSQIMYWHGYAKSGKRRQRVERNGHMWVAKTYDKWYEECRIPERTARASMSRLVKLGLIERHVWHFAGNPTVHVRVIPERFQELLEKVGRQEQQEGTFPVSGHSCQISEDVSIRQNLPYVTNGRLGSGAIRQNMSDAYTETTSTESTRSSISNEIDTRPPSSAEVAPVHVVEPQGSESPEPPAPEPPTGPPLPSDPPAPTAFPSWATAGLNPYQLQQLEELPAWLKELICQEPTQQTLFGAICLTQQWDVATLTETRKKEVGAVAAELLKAGAKPINLPSFWNWLKAKATAENWNSVTINAMKKFWPDFARELAKPDNKWVPYHLPEHPPETPQMFAKRAQMARDLLIDNRVEEAYQIGYDDVVAALQ